MSFISNRRRAAACQLRPERALAEAAAACGAPAVRPAADWCDVLLGRKGMVESLLDDPSVGPMSAEDVTRSTGQFGQASGDSVQQSLPDGFRLPQVLLGWLGVPGAHSRPSGL